jgi:hypothetical protein
MSDRKKLAKKVAKRVKKSTPSYSGQDPDEWHMNKYYTPFQGDLGQNKNLPEGEVHPLEFINFLSLGEDEKEVDKDVESNRDTIEMVLNRSDLSSKDQETAMDILPVTEDFFEFLRQKGLQTEVLIIKQILNYY